MNIKKRNHKIMILDKLYNVFAFIFTVLFYFAFNSEDINIVFVYVIVITAGVILLVLPCFLIIYFLYKKSFYVVERDKIYIERKTIFGYKKKEIYFNKVSTIKVRNKYYFKPFKAVLINFNTGSSVTASTNDVSIYVSQQEYRFIEEVYNNYKTFNNTENVSQNTLSEEKVINETTVKEDLVIKNTMVSNEEEVAINEDIYQFNANNTNNSEYLIREYTKSQSRTHVIVTNIVFLITSFISVLILLVITSLIDGVGLFAFILIVMPLISTIYRVVNKFLTLSNYKLYKTEKGFKVNTGSVSEYTNSVDFIDIKQIMINRSRIIDRSFLSFEAVGLSDSSSKDNGKVESIFSLLDYNQHTNYLLDFINLDLNNLIKLRRNYSYCIFLHILLHIIFIVLSFIILNYTQEKLAILFFVFTQLGLIIFDIYTFISNKYLIKYYYNDTHIVLKTGLFFEKTRILNKKDIQSLTIDTNIVFKRLSFCNLIFYNFKTDETLLGINLKNLNYNDVKILLDKLKPSM